MSKEACWGFESLSGDTESVKLDRKYLELSEHWYYIEDAPKLIQAIQYAYDFHINKENT